MIIGFRTKKYFIRTLSRERGEQCMQANFLPENEGKIIKNFPWKRTTCNL
jgi:hypothetical protein